MGELTVKTLTTFDKQVNLLKKKPAMGFFGGKPKEEPEKNYTGFQT